MIKITKETTLRDIQMSLQIGQMNSQLENLNIENPN